MLQSRQRVENLIKSIEFVAERTKSFKDELVEITNDKKYASVESFYLSALDKLKNIKKELPKGYRYSGTFYVKKVPDTFYSGGGGASTSRLPLDWSGPTTPAISIASIMRAARLYPTRSCRCTADTDARRVWVTILSALS